MLTVKKISHESESLKISYQDLFVSYLVLLARTIAKTTL